MEDINNNLLKKKNYPQNLKFQLFLYSVEPTASKLYSGYWIICWLLQLFSASAPHFPGNGIPGFPGISGSFSGSRDRHISRFSREIKKMIFFFGLLSKDAPNGLEFCTDHQQPLRYILPKNYAILMNAVQTPVRERRHFYYFHTFA